MNITQPYNNEVYIVNNFVTDDEVSFMHKYLNKFYSPNRNLEKDYDALKVTVKYKFLELQKRAEDIISSITGNQDYEFTPLYNFMRLSSGIISPHADNLKDGAKQNVMYGCILYWNNDFDGGQLQYPVLGLEYQPVPGDFVFHPGTEEYTHGVKEVVSGVRYTSTMFVKNRVE